MELFIANRIAVEYSCRRYHYAKTPINPDIAFGVCNDEGEFCGVICYGVGGGPYLGDEFGLVAGRWIELQRVALNGKQEITSKALALSIKLLKKYRPCKKIIISYADREQGHLGVIYKATNWYYLGVEAKSVKKIYDKWKKKYVHQRGFTKEMETKYPERYDIKKTTGKHKYIYVLDDRLNSLVKSKSKEYASVA